MFCVFIIFFFCKVTEFFRRQHILVLILNDNTDNNDNRKNGRNCGCHKVTYNTDNGITSATEKVVSVVFVVIVFVVVKREGE